MKSKQLDKIDFYLKKEKEKFKEFSALQKKIFVSFQKYSLNEILLFKRELFAIEEQLDSLRKIIKKLTRNKNYENIRWSDSFTSKYK